MSCSGLSCRPSQLQETIKLIFTTKPLIMKTTKELGALVLLFMLFIISSCADDTPECEMSNTGNIIIENKSTEGTLNIFFNKTGALPLGGSGDLNIPAGEKVSMELSAGQHNIRTKLTISTCSGGRCKIQDRGYSEKNINLSSCVDFNLVY